MSKIYPGNTCDPVNTSIILLNCKSKMLAYSVAKCKENVHTIFFQSYCSLYVTRIKHLLLFSSNNYAIWITAMSVHQNVRILVVLISA